MSHTFRRAAAESLIAALVLAAAVFAPPPAFADPSETKPGAAEGDPDYAAGKEALDRKDWAEAARRFSQAALRDPDNADLPELPRFLLQECR
jgi:hypothetical protein